MLLTLNNDCLEDIFRLLDLKTQINVRRLCQRFVPIVDYIWQKKYKTVEVADKMFRNVKDDKKDFIDFVSSISSSVEELHFDINSVEQLKWLGHLTFPKVKSLTCDFGSDVRDTLVIAKLFPILKLLKLSGTIAGRCTWRMRNPFQSNAGQHNTALDESIESITQCDNLTELSMDDHHLIMIIDELLQKNMHIRKLTSYSSAAYDALLLRKIADTPRGLQVQTLIYNRLFLEENNMDHINSIVKMKNIRKLVIKDGSFDNLEMEEICLIAENLPHLRELHLINCEIDGEDVLNLVVSSLQLEVLNLSGTKTNAKILLGLVASNVERLERTKERLVPLKVCCYQSDDFYKPDLEGIQMSVTYDEIKLNFDVPCPNSFQVEWID